MLEQREVTMKGTGSFGFGGAGIGSVGGDVTLDDGSKWRFFGAVIGFQIGVAAAVPVKADFPGASHMAGPCVFRLFGAAVGPGRFELAFNDGKEIGKVNGDGYGGSISFAGGVGGWTKLS